MYEKGAKSAPFVGLAASVFDRLVARSSAGLIFRGLVVSLTTKPVEKFSSTYIYQEFKGVLNAAFEEAD